MHTPFPVVLCVLDGFGINPDPSSHCDAIKNAHTPNLDFFYKNFPNAQLSASGQNVGLPDGQMGNSEVGHTIMGAGRLIWQDLPRIDNSIKTNNFRNLPQLQTFLKASHNPIHIMGLLSDGGVHAHINHIFALIDACDPHPIYLHLFLDGRDTPPTHGLDYIHQLINHIKDKKNVTIATLGGRYYAMDRDKRWDRIKKAYDVMTNPDETQSILLNELTKTIQNFYNQDITDEFIPPFSIQGYKGMSPGDRLLMANFRSDRVRQLLSTYLIDEFNEFERPKKLTFSATLGMAPYSDTLTLKIPALFDKQTITYCLGEWISFKGFTQLRIAETEKYAHVTFFFNGSKETPFDGEERILIPSPKIDTYDMQPSMSAPTLTNTLVSEITKKKFDFILVNYANPDMVGHTGNLGATQEAIECIDSCLGQLFKACESNQYTLILTADHGNAEEMKDSTGAPLTSHTINPVPFIVLDKRVKEITNGTLADIAPTVLQLMELEIPTDMTGKLLCSL